MKESLKFLLRLAKIQYRINSNDKKPRKFGTDQFLYQSEIHFIEAVELGTGFKSSELAQKLGITNGAVTQVADKLVKKCLVEKYKVSNNKKEVFIKLTREGQIAYENHRLFHKKLAEAIIKYLDSLSIEQMKAFSGLMDIIEKDLPDLNKEEK